jgi:hypothetical protein
VSGSCPFISLLCRGALEATRRYICTYRFCAGKCSPALSGVLCQSLLTHACCLAGVANHQELSGLLQGSTQQLRTRQHLHDLHLPSVKASAAGVPASKKLCIAAAVQHGSSTRKLCSTTCACESGAQGSKTNISSDSYCPTRVDQRSQWCAQSACCMHAHAAVCRMQAYCWVLLKAAVMAAADEMGQLHEQLQHP